MKTQVQKIANLLYLNQQYIHNNGLLNGKMGITLFFYEYSRFSKMEVYNDFADHMLDEIVGSISKTVGIYDFYDGLSGIGWGIQYLINNRFVDGDSNEILIDFDRKLQSYIPQLKVCNINEVANYFSTPDKLLSIDQYLLYRQKYRSLDIEEIQVILLFYIELIKTECSFPMLFLNSIFAFLIRIQNMGLCEDICNDLESMLLPSIKNSITMKLYDKSDKSVFLKLTELSTTKNKLDIQSIKSTLNVENKPISLSEEIELYAKNVWQELIYFNNNKQIIKKGLIVDYMNQIILKLSKENLTFNKGLVGIGIGIMNHE